MARWTMISGLQRARLTTSRGHSLLVLSGRVESMPDASVERAGAATPAGRASTARRQTVRGE